MEAFNGLLVFISLQFVPLSDCLPVIISGNQPETTGVRNQSPQTGSDGFASSFFPQYPDNNTLVTVEGVSSMRIFDHTDITHPEFNPSAFLRLAVSDRSFQPISLSFRFGDPYFMFLPPDVIKEQHMQARGPQEIRRHRVRRSHPNMLENVLGELQNYALVPIKSQTGKTQYILLKNPKFIIGGAVIGGKRNAPLPKIIQLPEDSRTSPYKKSPSRTGPSIVSSIGGVGIEGGTIEKLPGSEYGSGTLEKKSPVDLGQEYGASKAIFKQERPADQRSALQMSAVQRPAVHMSAVQRPAVHMSSVQMSRIHRPSVQTVPAYKDQFSPPTALTLESSPFNTHNTHSHGSHTSHVNSASSISGMATQTGSVLTNTNVAGSVMQATNPVDGHTVHETEVVETVVETKNQAAAVASQTNATQTASQSAVGAVMGGTDGGQLGKPITTKVDTAASVAASSSAAASKAETTVTKKTTKTSVVKDETGAVHHVQEIVEEKAVKKDAAAVSTDTAATGMSSSVAVSGGPSAGDGQIASMSSGSATGSASSSSASTAANATTVKKITKKTTITKTKKSPETLAAAPAVASAAATPDVPYKISQSTGGQSAKTSGSVPNQGASPVANLADNTVVKPLNDSNPATIQASLLALASNIAASNTGVTASPDKKKAKTAILSDNNDKPKSIGAQAAFIATPRPRAAAKVKVTLGAATTPVPTTDGQIMTTEEIELEDMMTTTSMPTPAELRAMDTTPRHDPRRVASSQTRGRTSALFRLAHGRLGSFHQKSRGAPGRSRDMSKKVAGWSPVTTEPPLGPNDRVNTTDVPEEIEPMPDKTPAELRAMGMTARKDTRTPPPVRSPGKKGGPRSTSAQERFNKRRQATGAGAKRPAARKRPGLRGPGGPGRRRQGKKGRRRPGSGSQAGTTEMSEETLQRRLQPRDPFLRWFMNNVDTSELLPDGIPLWALLGKK